MGERYYTVRATLERPYNCTNCGYATLASIRAKGTANNEHQAHAAMQDDAATALDFVNCPKCGKRNETAVRTATLKAVRNIVLAFAGALVVSLVVAGISDGGLSMVGGLTTGVVLGIIVAGIIFYVTLARWLMSNGRVTFVPPAR